MATSRSFVGVFGIIGVSVFLAPGTSEPRCSTGIPVGPALATQTLVLAVPNVDLIEIPLSDAEWHHLQADRPTPTTKPGSRLRAQVFTIVRIDTGEPRMPQLSPGVDVAVVPWGYDAGCELELWSGSVPWTRADTVLFRVDPAQIGAGARGVIHVAGWHEPYPDAIGLDDEDRGRSDRSTWLTAGEYFQFLAAMPRTGDVPWDTIRQEVHAWRQAHPTLAERFPVRELAGRLQ